MKLRKVILLAAAFAVLATVVASSTGVAAPQKKKKVTLVWWNNAVPGAGPGKALFDQVTKEFHKLHPNVTVKNVPIQNEALQKTKIPIALQSSNPPDVFQQWGGGELAEQVKAKKVADLTKYVKPWIKTIGGAAAGWQVNGKQYGIPYSLGVVGFWYNKDLFKKAGINGAPSNWTALMADIALLKKAGIAPLSVGGQDKWPDAFYWDTLAVKTCSKAVVQKTIVTHNFSDPCWVQAGVTLQKLLDAKPFNDGFLATPAQTGASSSAGLLANGKVAMELQGHWEAGVAQGLTPDGKVPSFLSWFPFPNIPGSKALPGSMLGGGDGFSCSWKAPQPACAQFLQYIASPGVQRRVGSTGFGLPVRKGTENSVADPNLRTILGYRSQSPFIQLYLDVTFGANIGNALNSAIADQFAGQATPQQVVDKISEAAKQK
jgi:raffinose/stachyose/melibiose transport system substrate-binding protein